MNQTKPFVIPKNIVMKAFQLIKSNAGTAGVDGQTLMDFEKNLKNNLYKLWNRMSSGSYFPPPVKAIPIPKKSGGERILGVPTVSDRIAQMVVKLMLEPNLEKYFLPDSYGYRPNKSAIDAIRVTRERCWQHDWVIEYDIQGLFDNIDHDLLMKALSKHTGCKWIKLYVERWLKTPMQLANGTLQAKTKGIMQGGVISPILSNLFLHYVVDVWITRRHPEIKWCRYADDGLLHCETLEKAQEVLSTLTNRFQECGLQLNPDKTKIVYCREYRRKRNYPNKKFDFLGYSFRSRWVKKRSDNSLFLSFTPAVSEKSVKTMKEKIRKQRLGRKSDMNIDEISELFNPILRGWLNYYGKYNQSSLYRIFRYFNATLTKWARRKFKKLKSKTNAGCFIEGLAKRESNLFVHWKIGITHGV